MIAALLTFGIGRSHRADSSCFFIPSALAFGAEQSLRDRSFPDHGAAGDVRPAVGRTTFSRSSVFAFAVCR